MADIEIIEREETTTVVRIPGMYKVIIHNDDTTPMDFVVMVLMTIFHHKLQSAVEIMQHVHLNGIGIAGSPYTREVAEQKTSEATEISRANGYPLTITFEEL